MFIEIVFDLHRINKQANRPKSNVNVGRLQKMECIEIIRVQFTMGQTSFTTKCKDLRNKKGCC